VYSTRSAGPYAPTVAVEPLAMTTLTLDLPADVFSALRRSPEEFGRELRLAAAIHWYQRGQISQENAAQVAGLDRTDFLMALAREGVGAFTVDFHDLQRELERC
jgi:predicted HTH domain antitoxin